MKVVNTPTRRWPAVLVLAMGAIGPGAWGQEAGAPRPFPPAVFSNQPAAQPPSGPAGRRAWGAAPSSAGVRRVQATPGDVSGPAAGATTPLPLGATPSPSQTDLSLPASERDIGGGEPTEAAAAAEAEEEEAEEPEPTLLVKALGLEDSPVKIYGWIQNSYTGNTNGKGNGENFGVFPNHLANSWMGNQYYIVVENALEQTDEVNFGFRVDNLFGHDWQFNKMYGLFDNAFKLNSFRGYDLAQLYGEVHLPVLTKGGIDVKGGRFYTIAGYEVVPAIGRPLLSVPYMFNFGQPFTHFGMISTWHVTDRLNLYNGTINGWDRWINDTYKWGYIGGFSWTSKSGNTSLATTLVWGPNQFPRFLPANTQVVPTGATPPPFLAGRRNLGYGGNDRTLFTTVLTHKWNDKLTQVIETDQAFEDNIPGLGPGGTQENAEWYSFGNWFLYSFNDKLTGVWRSEVFRDDDGIRTGLATNFAEITLGMIYKPQSWLWIRPEARYDWVRSGTPYSDGTRSSQFTIAFDVILLY